MKAIKILTVVGLVLVVAIGALAIALWTIDIDEFRQDFAEAATEALGREVKLEGKLELEISFAPMAVINDVRLANADWGSTPDMVRIGRMEARVLLIPYLLTGELRVPWFRVKDAEILLEIHADGKRNWIMATGPEASPTQDADDDVLLPIPREFVIEGARIEFRGPGEAKPVIFAVNRATGAAEDADSPLKLTWDLSYGDVPVTGSGTFGSLVSLGSATSAYPVSLKADAFGFDVELSGTVVDRRTAPKADLRLAVKAKTPTALRSLVGDESVPALPLTLSADILAGLADAHVRKFQVAFGATRLGGNVRVQVRDKRLEIDAEIVGQKLDLTELMATDGPGAQSSKADPAPPPGAAKKVFPSTPLPFDLLGAMDARLTVRIAEVVAPLMTAKDLSIKLKLEKARLDIPTIGATVAGSRIDARVRIDGARRVPSVSLTVKSKGFDLGRFLKEIGAGDYIATKGDIDVEVQGDGKSVAAIMAGLDGNVRALFGDGQVRAAELDALVGGVSRMVANLATASSDWVKLNCIAHHIEIVDGIATHKAFLIDTEHATVVGEGLIDLKQERLQMKVSPSAKSVTLNVAVPVKIKGTLAEPSFVPDEVGALIKLGGLLGVVLFPPAAIAAFFDLGASDDHPCAKISAAKP